MIKTEAGYVRQHVLVAEQKIGRKLLPREVAHHLDHDKLNNAPGNMVVWTHGEHSAHHNAHRAQIRNGTM